MNRIIARIIAFVMVLNTLFSNALIVAFSQSNSLQSRATSAINYNWNKIATLNDQFQLVERPTDSDEILLSWNMEKENGVTVTSGDYTLKYPISDGREIIFKVTKKSDSTATVTYSVKSGNGNGNSTVNNSNPLLIYKEGFGYVEANTTNFPNTNTGFTLIKVDNNGVANKVEFEVSKNGGVNFQYRGNTIKFVWNSNGEMYFVTNGIAQGNIYPFTLTTPNNSSTGEEIKIFLGIDTNNGFSSEPFANKDTSNQDGKGEIDQTGARPITEYPGGDTVGVKITFNTPKEWNSNNRKFEFVSSNGGSTGTGGSTNSKDTEVVFNLGHTDSTKLLQIKLPNIYDTTSNATATVESHQSAKVTASYSYDSAKNNVTLTIENLEASTIYKDITISIDRPGDPFESISSKLSTGSIYTYLSYKIISLDVDEFYIQIDPFEGYDGYYTVYQGSTKSNMERWAVHEDKKTGSETILIPVALSALNPHERYYRVDFSFTPPDINNSTSKFTSQTLKYKPYKEDISLSTPKNLEVESSNIIRDDDGKDYLYVQFKWDIGYDTVIQELMNQNVGKEFELKYSFSKSDTPDDSGEEFADINLKFSDDDDLTRIDWSLADASDKNSINLINDEDRTYAVIKSDSKNNILEAHVTFKIPVSSVSAGVKNVLQYPGVYFITTKGEYTITTTNSASTTTVTGSSLYTTLTLNGVVDIAVPAPQNLKITETTEKAFKVEYDTLKYESKNDVLYTYNKLMLNTLNRMLTDNSVRYDFYITKDKDIFDEMIEALKNEEKLENTTKNKIKTYTLSGNTSTMLEIEVNAKKDQIDDKNIIDYLRDGAVIEISTIVQNFSPSTQKLSFTGLDENETYYVMGRTTLIPYDKDGNEVVHKKDMSEYSTIVTTTTINVDGDVTESEKVPAAPAEFRAEDITLNSVNLIWTRVNEVEAEDQQSKLEYQFIKIKGQEMPEEILKSRDSYESTWQSLSGMPNKTGIRTDNSKIYEFDEDSMSFSNTAADTNRYEYVTYAGEQGNILDMTLAPNQVYFYYVRTVRVLDGEDKAYSVWVPLAFTTKNTTGPENLRIERDAEYDKKSEVVISFDIPKIDTSLIGIDYDLQYSLREDLEPWGTDITMPRADLTFEENEDGKTLKVTYKITGLSPGLTYTIRVRLVDNVYNSVSVYSNEVEYRTDTDNATNEYDEKITNWETYFKDLIEKLKKQSYWFLKDTTGTTSVYYRPQYFDEIVTSSNNSIIDLVSGNNASYKEYYLPASAILKAFDANKGFRITNNGAEVIFTAQSINPNQNEYIKQIVEELNSNKENIKDYFVKLSVNFVNQSFNIDGASNVSPIANISVQIIATRSAITEIDSKVLSYIEELLNTEKFSESVTEKIKSSLTDKKENTEFINQLDSIFEDFKSEVGSELSSQIKNITSTTLNIPTLNGSIVFVYSVDSGLSVSGYKRVGTTWTSVTVSEYAGKKAIYTTETGEYVFTAKKLIINGVGNLPNGDKITNIVIKYGLEDYLATDGNINLNANMTRHMAVGSLARIAGATKTQDPIEFFKTKGIVLTTRNTTENIPTEEAVYLMMQVYEIRTNQTIDSIKIRNYNLTSGIQNISSKYKKSIQVSFDLGIYNNENMSAKGAITVKEFLTSLANMSNLIDL